MNNFSINTGNELIELNIPNNYTYEILEPNKAPLVKNDSDAVRESLSSPIASPRLKEIVKPGEKISLLVCDNTRYVPNKVILPQLIEELLLGGVYPQDITIVIANGTHRQMTEDEIYSMLGENISGRFKVVNHNAYDENNLVYLGKSKKSIPIVLNKNVVESDVRIGVGVVEPHLFAGYSGGVKILSVGVAGRETIAATHNAKLLENPGTKYGDIEGNVFRGFLNEVADIVSLDFITNVVLDDEKRMLGVFSGESVKAFEKAVDFAKTVYEVKTEKKADVIITVPKYPKCINLYQAIRAANSVLLGKEPLVKKGGHIIIPARCPDGIGSVEFYDDLAKAEDPYEVILKARDKGFPPEGHKPFTVARMMQHCKIVITDTDINQDLLMDMHFSHEINASAALNNIGLSNLKPHLLILPDGCITVGKLK